MQRNNVIKQVLMLLLMLTLVSCSGKSLHEPVDAQPRQKLPPLSTEAKQPARPLICSTTCSEGLMKLRTQLLNMLTQQESPEPPAKDRTKK